MIRIICFEDNSEWAANVGCPVNIKYRTFDFDLPELEAWLLAPKRERSYIDRGITGIELIENKENNSGR